jgi:ligand-binding SRPBCC domain-containing protein
MAEHILNRKLTIPSPRTEVFEFFSNAANLELITPPDLNFHILTPQPIEIDKGTLIDYQLGLYGIPVRWRSEITIWDPPNEFVDTQLSGPYSQWIHRHTFKEISENETLMEDEVRYRLPLEPLGDIGHFFVRRQLEYIFDHRQKVIADLFGVDQPSHSPQ